MAVMICPNCNKPGFTWHIDKDKSPLTKWRCSLCEYEAEEDESNVTNCPNCHRKTLSTLEDKDRVFQWCGMRDCPANLN